MKIKDIESKFYVKDNKVTCVMTGKVYLPDMSEEEAYDRVVKYLNRITSGNCVRVHHSSFYSPYSIQVVSRAICSKEDTFDAKVGTRLSQAKAKAKLDRIMVSLNDFVARLFMEEVMKATNHASKYQSDRNHQLEYIKEF